MDCLFHLKALMCENYSYRQTVMDIYDDMWILMMKKENEK
jgi:hypothetical protein